VLISRDYLPGLSDESDEYYLLLLLATLGAVVLAYSSHVASLLLGLELMSVSLYALIAYPSRAPAAAEAATKYMVLSGAASATMLFGFALLYALAGSLEFAALGAALPTAEGGSLLQAFAAVLIVSGLCFKLSVAPFHLWTPDVYEGSPSPITAFLATVAKAAPFVALLRLVFAAGLLDLAGVVEVLALLAVLSMLVGNLLALLQDNVKRILAYSSIAHMGYALLIFTVAANPEHRALAGEAGAFYFLAYVPTTLAAFGLLSLLNAGGDGADRAAIDDLGGLFWRQPVLAVMLVVALLSLAGIPLTAGFIGKFYLFAAAVEGSHWVLLAALVTGSAIGIYYYLRMVYQMTLKPEGDGAAIKLDAGVVAVALLLVAAILVLGVLPQGLMVYLQGIF
jgi:NADH-quinone oxidoreductase subunit N